MGNFFWRWLLEKDDDGVFEINTSILFNTPCQHYQQHAATIINQTKK